MEKEWKRCWECGEPVTIHEYGYGVCYQKQKHQGGSIRHVFGSGHVYKYVETSPSRFNGYENYSQYYYYEVLKKKGGLLPTRGLV